jgi:C4-dicarboxylate-specific signal transduction histidine kinase
MLLEHERDNKLMNLGVMAASIAHEVRQPLAAIAANGSAALRFLGRTPADLEEVRSSLNSMINDSHGASQIFDNLRVLFGKSDKGRELIDVNEMALGALQTLRGELDEHEVLTRTELTSEVLHVMGHRGQLNEVIINLVQNAIDAMGAVKKNLRVLRLSTERRADAIIVAVEDSGPGIDPKKSDSIFDAFVTTKSNGTGLGLAICRMIVERHEGQLSVAPAQPHGCIFQIVLPQTNLSP